eukprot:s1742_g9.t1
MSQAREGFVRLALQHGVPIVPVYVFGEAQLFQQSKFLFGLRSWIQKKLGIALVMPYGPFGLPFTKFPDPIRMVVGKPVAMPRMPDHTSQDLQEHHARQVNMATGMLKKFVSCLSRTKHQLGMETPRFELCRKQLPANRVLQQPLLSGLHFILSMCMPAMDWFDSYSELG